MKSFVAILLLAANVAHSAPRQLTIAIPETAGRLSLAAFDASANRVRTLAAAADISEFRAGLDGILIEWDGLDDHGQPVPQGTYHLRGLFIPETVSAEGEAYLFNDWESQDGTPLIRKILTLAPKPDGRFLIVAEEARSGLPRMWQADAEGRLNALRPGPLPSDAKILALNERAALLSVEGRVELLPLSDEQGHPLAKSAARLGALSRTRAALCVAPRQIALYDLANPSAPAKEHAVPSDLRLLAPCGDGFVAILENDQAVLVRDSGVSEISVGDTQSVRSLSVGPDGSFWLTGLTGNRSVARNFDPEKGLLREMRLDPEAGPSEIFGEMDGAGFFLLTANATHSTLRSVRPSASGTSESPWEITLEKTIQECASFGFAKGVPSANAPAHDELTVLLDPSPLAPLQGSLPIRAKTQDDRVCLETAEGLKIIEVAHLPGISRVAIAHGKTSGSVRVLVGQPGFVAEFLATGLHHLTPLDEGTVEISP